MEKKATRSFEARGWGKNPDGGVLKFQGGDRGE